MLTFEKVLEIFADYLTADETIEVYADSFLITWLLHDYGVSGY